MIVSTSVALAAIAASESLVSNDSGLMHVAAAFGVPYARVEAGVDLDFPVVYCAAKAGRASLTQPSCAVSQRPIRNSRQ